MLRRFCQQRIGLSSVQVQHLTKACPLAITCRRLHQERIKVNNTLFTNLEELPKKRKNVVAQARRKTRQPIAEENAPAHSADPFLQLELDDRVTMRLPEMGVEVPTKVQEAAIPHILNGDNVAIQCYTGSGKTLAYLLPVLAIAVQRAEQELIEAREAKKMHMVGQVQAVVVAPSRELAMQIFRVAQNVLPKGAEKAVQQCIGGANIMRQADALRVHKPLVVVGTPGRLAELNRQGVLQTHKCPLLVLDEVDQLLSPHFREEMMRVSDHTGRKLEAGRQTIIVSATLTHMVLDLCSAWCPDPVQVFVGQKEGQQDSSADTLGQLSGVTPVKTPTWGWSDALAEDNIRGSAGGVGTSTAALSLPPGLRHLHVETTQRHKVNTLRRAIHALDVKKALVFMNHSSRLKDVMYKLEARKMEVAVMHGEMSKLARKTILEDFKQGSYRALLVSDVMARGLDIPDCDAVFHLELPSDASHYAHRAGRTGRMGRSGIVVSLVEPREKFVINKLSRRLQLDIQEVKLSHGEAVEVGDEEDVEIEGSQEHHTADARNTEIASTTEMKPREQPTAKKEFKNEAVRETEERATEGKSTKRESWRARKLPPKRDAKTSKMATW